MTRLVTIFLLVLMLIPAFLLPATVNAFDCDVVSTIITPQTLPVTQITSKTAVFTGKFYETVQVKINNQNGDYTEPWAFEYGTTPGAYPNTIRADIVNITNDSGSNGDIVWAQICFTFKATVQNLEPCTTYHVRFVSRSAVWRTIPCITIWQPNDVTFTTPGCLIKTLGSGGVSSNPGTPTSLSSLPVSAPIQMASVVVQSATVATTKVSPGQDVDIAASVTNKGSANGDAKLTLYVNGEAVESKGVTVASGQTVPVHFNVSRNEPGTYDIYVNSVPAGSFSVDVLANNDNIIYSIMALLLLSIAGTVYLMMRKKTPK